MAFCRTDNLHHGVLHHRDVTTSGTKRLRTSFQSAGLEFQGLSIPTTPYISCFAVYFSCNRKLHLQKDRKSETLLQDTRKCRIISGPFAPKYSARCQRTRNKITYLTRRDCKLMYCEFLNVPSKAVILDTFPLISNCILNYSWTVACMTMKIYVNKVQLVKPK